MTRHGKTAQGQNRGSHYCWSLKSQEMESLLDPWENCTRGPLGRSHEFSGVTQPLLLFGQVYIWVVVSFYSSSLLPSFPMAEHTGRQRVRGIINIVHIFQTSVAQNRMEKGKEKIRRGRWKYQAIVIQSQLTFLHLHWIPQFIFKITNYNFNFYIFGRFL